MMGPAAGAAAQEDFGALDRRAGLVALDAGPLGQRRAVEVGQREDGRGQLPLPRLRIPAKPRAISV